MLGLSQKLPLFKATDIYQAVILFLFCFPLFFQLSGSIFTAPDAFYDSQGSLLRLPLPIASVICFIGIALFLRLEERYFGMGFVFSFFMLMMLSTIVSTGGYQSKVELAKFIHLVQFVLPCFALVLGNLYLRPASVYLSIEAIGLYVLMIIIPLEVSATLASGHTLSAHLFFFSLYQHFHYLPVIFFGFYFLAAASFYQKGYLRTAVIFLAPWMGIYLAQALSVMAMMLAVYGSIIIVWVLYRKNKTAYAAFLIALALVAYLVYLPFVKDTLAYSTKFGQITQLETIGEAADTFMVEKANGDVESELLQSLPEILRQRFHYWGFYSSEILKNPDEFVFGHAFRLDRNIYPGAHNYYLDLVYHFGFLSLLPFLYLILISMRKFRAAVKESNYSPGLVMQVALVAFFVFIVNFFTAGFSQPYPGMMMLFLWGALFAKILAGGEAGSEKPV